jgi:hypothetical protein
VVKETVKFIKGQNDEQDAVDMLKEIIEKNKQSQTNCHKNKNTLSMNFKKHFLFCSVLIL